MIVPVTLIPAGLIPGYFPGYFPGYCPDFLFLSIKQTAGVHDVISQTQQHVAPAVPGFIAAAVHGVIFQTQQLQPGCKDIVLCPDRSPLYRPFRRRSGRRSALTSRSCRCSCRPILNSHLYPADGSNIRRYPVPSIYRHCDLMLRLHADRIRVSNRHRPLFKVLAGHYIVAFGKRIHGVLNGLHIFYLTFSAVITRLEVHRAQIRDSFQRHQRNRFFRCRCASSEVYITFYRILEIAVERCLCTEKTRRTHAERAGRCSRFRPQF